MKLSRLARLFVLLMVASSLLAGLTLSSSGQSRRQPPTSNQKKNQRPNPDEKPAEEPLPPDLAGKPQEAERISVSTQIVNIDAVVYHKKSGQIVTGLKKANFAIFADGNEQVITNFATPEAPITV